MPPPLTPWTAKIYELLADGQWHDREPVVAAAAKAVPPGRAKRTAEDERVRERGRRATKGLPPLKPRTDAELIQMGQRAIALLVLNRNRRIETRGRKGARQVRLLPRIAPEQASDGRFLPRAGLVQERGR